MNGYIRWVTSFQRWTWKEGKFEVGTGLMSATRRMTSGRTKFWDYSFALRSWNAGFWSQSFFAVCFWSSFLALWFKVSFFFSYTMDSKSRRAFQCPTIRQMVRAFTENRKIASSLAIVRSHLSSFRPFSHWKRRLLPPGQGQVYPAGQRWWEAACSATKLWRHFLCQDDSSLREVCYFVKLMLTVGL